MRDALSLLDQAIAYGGGKVEEPQVRDMLGAIDETYLYAILEALAQGDGPGLVVQAEQMEERSLSFESALQDLGVLLHRIALAQTVPEALGEDSPERGRVLALAQRFSPEDVQLFYQIALHGRRDLYLAPDEFAGFSMTLLRMLAFTLEGAASSGDRPMAGNSSAGAERPRPTAQSQRSVAASPVETAQPAPAAALRDEPPLSPPVADNAAKNRFDGDWPGLVARLRLGGMAKMLAQHCELKNHTEGLLELCVPEEHKHLADKSYQDKLKSAVAEYFGADVRLTISIGAITGMTPERIERNERAAKQAEAVAAIEGDSFVRDLIENLDAQVVESSIKPLQ